MQESSVNLYYDLLNETQAVSSFLEFCKRKFLEKSLHDIKSNSETSTIIALINLKTAFSKEIDENIDTKQLKTTEKSIIKIKWINEIYNVIQKLLLFKIFIESQIDIFKKITTVVINRETDESEKSYDSFVGLFNLVNDYLELQKKIYNESVEKVNNVLDGVNWLVEDVAMVKFQLKIMEVIEKSATEDLKRACANLDTKSGKFKTELLGAYLSAFRDPSRNINSKMQKISKYVIERVEQTWKVHFESEFTDEEWDERLNWDFNNIKTRAEEIMKQNENLDKHKRIKKGSDEDEDENKKVEIDIDAELLILFEKNITIQRAFDDMLEAIKQLFIIIINEKTKKYDISKSTETLEQDTGEKTSQLTMLYEKFKTQLITLKIQMEEITERIRFYENEMELNEEKFNEFYTTGVLAISKDVSEVPTNSFNETFTVRIKNIFSNNQKVGSEIKKLSSWKNGTLENSENIKKHFETVFRKKFAGKFAEKFGNQPLFEKLLKRLMRYTCIKKSILNRLENLARHRIKHKEFIDALDCFLKNTETVLEIPCSIINSSDLNGSPHNQSESKLMGLTISKDKEKDEKES